MKRILFAILFGSMLLASASGQQGPARRRGLDQLDLVSMPQKAEPMVGKPIVVDLQMYSTLDPLVEACRDLEQTFKAEVVNKPDPMSTASFSAQFRRKTDAVSRSIYLLRQMKNVPPQILGLLDDIDDYGKELGMVVAGVYSPPTDVNVKNEIAMLRAKYSVPDGDLKFLAAAVLRQINANFSRLKIAQ